MNKDEGKTLRAMGRNVVIMPDPKPDEEISEGGIVIAESEDKREEFGTLIYGTVVSIGQGGSLVDQWGDEGSYGKPDESLLLQHVAYRKIDVKEIDFGGETYHALDFDEIVGVDAAEAEPQQETFVQAKA